MHNCTFHKHVSTLVPVSSLHKYIAFETKSNLICKSMVRNDLKNAGGAKFTNV
jgi:hypothetical protein